MNSDIKLLRIHDVAQRTGRKKSTIYLNVRRGVMLPPVRLGPRISAWPSHEVDALIATEIGGATPDELREFVRKTLEARRRKAVAA